MCICYCFTCAVLRTRHRYILCAFRRNRMRLFVCLNVMLMVVVMSVCAIAVNAVIAAWMKERKIEERIKKERERNHAHSSRVVMVLSLFIFVVVSNDECGTLFICENVLNYHDFIFRISRTFISFAIKGWNRERVANIYKNRAECFWG